MKIILLTIVVMASFALSLPVNAQDEIVTEKIIYAVNEDYTLLNPQWKTGVQDVIDAANVFLAQNTNKRYAIQEFRTFNIADWNQLSGEPAFHFDNGYGGTTIFHWVETPNTTIKPDVNYTYFVNATNYTTIQGVSFQQLYLVENHYEHSALLGKGKDTFTQWINQLFMHELGHSMGLSVPDWYLYEFEDLSGVEPHLFAMNLRAQYAYDPMASWTAPSYRYTDFNAAIINKNLRHEKNFLDIQSIASSRVRIIVRDANGVVMPNATVQVFGGQKGCVYCKEVVSNPLLETATTSASGEAVIAAPSVEWASNDSATTKYIGLIVKASKGDLRGGAYVITQQMQQNKFLTGRDIFDLPITIDTRYTSRLADEQGIRIEQLRATDITQTSAVIRWQTTYKSNWAQYRYAAKSSNIDAAVWWTNTNSEDRFENQLSGLQPATQYVYQVKNRATGKTETWTQAQGEFTTLGEKVITSDPVPDLNKDSDLDGLSDSDEVRLGTNPTKKDTDGDGYLDAEEVRTGHDPLKVEPPVWKKFENKKFSLIFTSPSAVNEYDEKHGEAVKGFSVGLTGSTAVITVYEKTQFLKEHPWIAKPLLQVAKNYKKFKEDKSTKNRAKKAAGSGPSYLQWLKRKIGGLPALDHRYANPGGVGRSVYIIRGSYVYEIFHDRGYVLNKKGELNATPYKDFEKFLASIRFVSNKPEKK